MNQRHKKILDMLQHGRITIPDTADEWLDSFEMFSIYTVLPQIIELWRLNEMTTSQPKKKVTE